MKRFLLVLAFAICSTWAFSQTKVVKGERPPINLEEVSPDAYEPGKIKIKLKPGMEKSLPDVKYKALKSGYVVTGVQNIDELNKQFGATQFTPLLDGIYQKSAKSSANREKHVAWGFHLWFEIDVNSKANVKEMVKKYSALEEIEFAEPVYKKQLIGHVKPVDREEGDTKGSKWTPSDPRYSEQWHYHNTGQQSGTVDKDIDLPEAWDIEKGNSSVIVAVIDGGIQTNHPDLSGNIWSGVGYNFVNNSSTIVAHEHGTHVAGTVAAETNNSTGVAGVAGGSGSNDGVRLMSCQVFTSSSSGGFDQAAIYAADNGASISQNSWGYTSVNVYDQSTLDAIDYFNANGGGNALNGGITIFAAGNSDATGNWYPGCYSGTFSVAATNNKDVRSYYSNYGDWVDISAPGGEQSYEGDPKGILSTITNSSYGFMQGTSMACPHVSGVAALLVSNAVRNGLVLTNTQLRNLLSENVDNHYSVNTSYTGKLGSGRLNAYKALQALQSMFSNDPPVANFTASSTSVSEGNTVTFTSTSTGSPTSYSWTFEGGTPSTSTSANPTVTYNTIGTYDVQLTVSNAYGSDSETKANYITVTEYVPEYCASAGSNYSYEWIAGVAVGTFNNTSAAAGYTDFTSKTITMAAGTAYNVTLTPGFASSAYNEYWKIWVDLNGDADFDDANELVFDAGALSQSAVTGTVTIPSGTAAITTRMRVSMKYNAAQTACETFSYGEVEDYTVVITSGGDTQAPTAPSNLAASSVTQTTLTLNWTASTDNVGVTGYDVYRNGSLLGSVTSNSANVTGLTAATTYSFYVKAKDAAGNVSAASNTISVTTQSADDTQAPTAPSNLAASNITQTTLTLSWTASTDNVGVTGYDVYRNGSYLATATSTSYNVSGLTASTTYSFYVKAKDAAGNVSAASNTISVVTPGPIEEYCTSKGNNSSYEWIAKVQLGTYSKSSGAAGYSDFTSENIALQAGSSVAVTLTPGFASSTYNEYWKIWIDYNNDYEFGTDELVFDAGALSKTAVSGTITIPSSATGTTRMRVSMKYNAAQTACETFSYGEVEDYTVTFGQVTPDTEAPTAPTGLASSNVAQTSLTLSWNASTDNVGVTGYDVYRNGSLLSSVTSTSANVTGLSAATTYSFYVKAKDAAGNISVASNTINVTTLPDIPNYCASKGNNVNYEWIDLVQLNEINNVTSKNGGYADFTSMVANVALGSSQTIYVSCGFASSTYTEYWHVWIDWDHSGTFDSDEQMVSGSSSSSATLSATFTVPSDALLGATRMRVTMKYNAAATACETFSYGEVEDYTVNVSNTGVNYNFASVDANELGNDESTNIVVYPNPADSYINVNVVNGTKIGNINIYNMVGSLVKVIEIEGNDQEIDISELPAGSYLISVEDERESIVKTFIKK